MKQSIQKIVNFHHEACLLSPEYFRIVRIHHSTQAAIFPSVFRILSIRKRKNAGKNPIAKGDFQRLFTRNCKGTELLRDPGLPGKAQSCSAGKEEISMI